MCSNVVVGVTCPSALISPLEMKYCMSLLNSALSIAPSCHFLALSVTQNGICVVALCSSCCFSLFASAIRCLICSSMESSVACVVFCVPACVVGCVCEEGCVEGGCTVGEEAGVDWTEVALKLIFTVPDASTGVDT